MASTSPVKHFQHLLLARTAVFVGRLGLHRGHCFKEHIESPKDDPR